MSSIIIINKALEVTTKLILNDKKDSLEKAFFEIKYATVITIDETVSDKDTIRKNRLNFLLGRDVICGHFLHPTHPKKRQITCNAGSRR